jgi:hypothetical protein
MTSKKGFVTFFLNIGEHNKHISVDDYINLMKTHNQAAVDVMAEEGYVSVFVPCFDEACRVEKRNFVNDTKSEEKDKDDEENDNIKRKKRE